MKTSQKRYGAEDIRFASNTSHIDNTVKSWFMTPEELAAYKKGTFGGDKMNGLTKEKYVELKNEKLKDTEIAKSFRLSPPQLIEWKKQTFTPYELKALNLPKRIQKADMDKTIREEIKRVETENTTSQDDVSAEYEKTIKELKYKLETDREKYDRAIQEVYVKLDLEQEAKKRMSAAHQTNIQKFIDEKELAYQKAKSEHEQYLDTLEKLRKTDIELEDAKQRIKEIESERDQLKLSFDQATALLNPLRQLVKVAL